MTTKTYARIQDNAVAELFATDGDMTELFNPALVWLDVTGIQGVSQGWLYDGSTFAPPKLVAAPAAPSLAELQAQLQALALQIAALTKA